MTRKDILEIDLNIGGSRLELQERKNVFHQKYGEGHGSSYHVTYKIFQLFISLSMLKSERRTRSKTNQSCNLAVLHHRLSCGGCRKYTRLRTFDRVPCRMDLSAGRESCIPSSQKEQKAEREDGSNMAFLFRIGLNEAFFVEWLTQPCSLGRPHLM